jgi:hypothetical protein
LKQEKNSEILTFLLRDDTDRAKQRSNTNNWANLDICAKSFYVVSFGTQRKGMMKKIETKNLTLLYL